MDQENAARLLALAEVVPFRTFEGPTPALYLGKYKKLSVVSGNDLRRIVEVAGVDGRRLCVKVFVLRPKRRLSTENRALHEVELLCAVSPHPSIVSVAELVFDVAKHRLCLVMECLGAGSPLVWDWDRVCFAPVDAPNSEARLARLLRDICRALRHLHAKGISHGDVKAENIVASSDGTYKLIDFGCAYRADEDVPPLGTLYYLAPECLEANFSGNGFAADVWALGVFTFAFLFLRPPFSGETASDVREEIRSRRLSLPALLEERSVSGPLVELLLSMLDRDPARRPRAADILSHRFLRCLSTSEGFEI